MLRIGNGELESGVLCDRRERLAAHQTLFVAAAHDKQGAVRAQAAGVRDRIRTCPCQPEHASRILKCVFHSALEFGHKKFCGARCVTPIIELRRVTPGIRQQAKHDDGSEARCGMCSG